MANITPEAEGKAVQYAARCLLSLCKAIDQIETHQLKNFQEAALASHDIRSIETWVLYQIGRSKEGEGWRTKAPSRKAFGDAVLQSIKDLKSELDYDSQSITPRDYLELVRMFAGQLSRLHTYAEAQTKDRSFDPWPAIEELEQERA